MSKTIHGQMVKIHIHDGNQYNFFDQVDKLEHGWAIGIY